MGDACGPQLVVFGDRAPDEPIRGRHGGIDHACGGAPGLVDDVHHVSQEALIFAPENRFTGFIDWPGPLLLGTLDQHSETKSI